MTEYKCVAVSPGLALGRIRKLTRNAAGLSRLIDTPEKERELFDHAIATAQKELDGLIARASEGEKDIFTFQSCLLEDGGLLEEAYQYIAAGAGAAAAMERVGKIYADRMRNIDSEYLQLRCADVLDASQRVVDILDGRSRKKMRLSHPVIIASDTFLPSDLFIVPTNMIIGLATAKGSNQSHASIIARALGIPSVLQVGDEFLEACDGKFAAIDADNGVLILDPDSQTRQAFVNKVYEKQRQNEKLKELRDVPCYTKDGAEFNLMANCFMPEDITYALEAGAKGVGLLRTESLLSKGNIPDEQEQYEFYKRCILATKGAPITIRTFDIGVNRESQNIGGGELPTHALGLRGIRFGRSQPQFLETQLCALLRASAHGPLEIVFPMVSNPEDWRFILKAVDRCKSLLTRRGIAFSDDVKLGIMMEVPSACLMARELLELGCSFLSIGMNDLVQYTHAADRNLSLLEPYYQPNSPAIKRLIQLVVQAAKEFDVPVSISGLSVASPSHTRHYLHQGIRTFSMPADKILAVKKLLLESHSGDLARAFLQL